MRLFVSVDLPDALAEAVSAVQDRLADADGLRFTDPTQAHCTVKFLGETDPGRVEQLTAALENAVDAADVESFEATAAGLGVFPDIEYISVVWLGLREDVAAGDDAGPVVDADRDPSTAVGPAPRLGRLQAAIERECVALGFDREDHAFTPHVTIARMDHAGGKERVQRTVRGSAPVVGSFTVDAIHLTESELGPDGPEYSTVTSVPLG